MPERKQFDELHAAIRQALADGRFETPRAMLSRHCMICGKALTDPASMARFIGPECYGSGTLDVPWLHEATEAAATTAPITKEAASASALTRSKR
jgi:hypothetical protein